MSEINSSILVSIVMPVFNAEGYLLETINQITQQSLREIELIIINDNSTDNSKEIIKNNIIFDSRIKLISNDQNLGAGASRNIGLSLATGKYVIFLDDDDHIEKDMIFKLYHHAEKLDAEVVVCRSDFINFSTKNITETPWTIRDDLLPNTDVFSGNEINRDYFRAFTWWPWDKLFKREYVLSNHVLFQEIRTSNDLFFICAQLLLANRISVVNDVLIHHTVMRGSSLENSRQFSYECALLAIKKLLSFLIEKDLFDKYRKDFFNYCIFFLEWNINSLNNKVFHNLYDDVKAFLLSFEVDDSCFNDHFLKEAFERISHFDSEDYLFDLKKRLQAELSNKNERLILLDNLSIVNEDFASRLNNYDLKFEFLSAKLSEMSTFLYQCKKSIVQEDIQTFEELTVSKKSDFFKKPEKECEGQISLESTDYERFDSLDRTLIFLEKEIMLTLKSLNAYASKNRLLK